MTKVNTHVIPTTIKCGKYSPPQKFSLCSFPVNPQPRLWPRKPLICFLWLWIRFVFTRDSSKWNHILSSVLYLASVTPHVFEIHSCCCVFLLITEYYLLYGHNTIIFSIHFLLDNRFLFIDLISWDLAKLAH